MTRVPVDSPRSFCGLVVEKYWVFVLTVVVWTVVVVSVPSALATSVEVVANPAPTVVDVGLG